MDDDDWEDWDAWDNRDDEAYFEETLPYDAHGNFIDATQRSMIDFKRVRKHELSDAVFRDVYGFSANEKGELTQIREPMADLFVSVAAASAR